MPCIWLHVCCEIKRITAISYAYPHYANKLIYRRLHSEYKPLISKFELQSAALYLYKHRNINNIEYYYNYCYC